MDGEREIIVGLTNPVPQGIRDRKELAVENATYTPEVTIRGNYFARIPTRGILVTTRRPVLIDDNLFFRTQMSAILIADDARSWYESGVVRNVCIRGNRFEECGTPVINIAPENDRDGGCVHSGISIQNNCFRLSGHPAVAAKSVDGLRIEHNTIYSSDEGEPFHTQSCMNVYIQENLNIPKDKGNAHPG
jgi:hypothetical protein